MLNREYIYLAGPIGGCTDEEATGWRKYIKENINTSCVILDPMTRDYRGHEDDAVEKIVEEDKNDIACCDIMIANAWKTSPGTCMEILYAWEQVVDVILILPKNQPISPWYRAHATYIVHTLDEALELINDK